MVNGKVIYRDGVLLGVDEKRLAMEAENICTRVIRDQNLVFKSK